MLAKKRWVTKNIKWSKGLKEKSKLIDNLKKGIEYSYR